MSRLDIARFARKPTSWFLLFLCLSLLAWRINFRIEQCQLSNAGTPVVVAFFDSNERNMTFLDEMELNLRAPNAAGHLPFESNVDSSVVSFLQTTATHRCQRKDPVLALSIVFVFSAPLFSNPPPTVLA